MSLRPKKTIFPSVPKIVTPEDFRAMKASRLDPKVLAHYEEVAPRIKAIRFMTRQHQALFARNIGITRQSLNNYEQGKSRPSITMCMGVSLRTGVTLDFIYLGRFDGLTFEVANKLREEMARIEADKDYDPCTYPDDTYASKG